MNRNLFKKYGIFFLFLTILVVQLYWRYRLGVVRYFDIDEFAHLHWGFNFFSGMKPYKDFLYFFPPGFLFFLYPLFVILPKTAEILIGARILMYLMFLVMLLGLFFLFRLMRGTRIALFALMVLSFLPIPYDKFLEVRPDTLAVMFSVWGMYALIRGVRECSNVPMENVPMKGKYSRFSNLWWLFLSGLFYGLGLMVLPKVVFFVICGIVIVVAMRVYVNKLPKSPRSVRKFIGTFMAGLLIPGVITLGFFLWSGELAKAVYLTATFASRSSKVLGDKFYMFPSHFFWPNDTYYAESGFSLPLVANLLVYVIGSIWGIKAFVSSSNKAELLLSLTFLTNIIAFIKLVPLKHAQYFILFSPFIAFYFSEFVISLISQIRLISRSEKLKVSILFIILSFIIWKGYTMYSIKSKWTNIKTFDELKTTYQTIPPGSYVWDLYGQTIFYKDPYYICCVPYGQYEEAFGFALPSLSRALEETDTKYIFAHNQGRLSVLPAAHKSYVEENYTTFIEEPLILGKLPK